MSDPKTSPAFPCGSDEDEPAWGGPGMGDRVKAFREWQVARRGLSQYAEVAARFHVGLVTWERHSVAARHAFDHADAFFAELAKRTKP